MKNRSYKHLRSILLAFVCFIFLMAPASAIASTGGTFTDGPWWDVEPE